MKEVGEVVALILLMAFLIASCNDEGMCWQYNEQRNCFKLGEAK